MAFQLHIRQNLDSARDHFGPGRVCRFDLPVVRVGSAATSECLLAAADCAPCHLVLRSAVEPLQRVSACPQEGATTYLNGKELVAPSPLCSGDELRIGHWTLRYQSIHEITGRNRSFNLMSGLAKAAVVLILCLELVVVIGLPRRMQAVAMWETQIEQNRLVDQLQRLQKACRASQSTGDFGRTLGREISSELQARAEYLVEYGSRLTPARTRLLHEELADFDHILKALAAQALPPALPEIELDAGVRALLQAERRR